MRQITLDSQLTAVSKEEGADQPGYQVQLYRARRSRDSTDHNGTVVLSRSSMESMAPQTEAMAMDPEMLRSKIAENKARDQKEIEEREAARAAHDKAIADDIAAGKAAFAAGDFAEAEKKFDAALLSNAPNRVELLCNRAAALIKLGRFADAACDAAEAANFEPSFVKAHYRLACALKSLGQKEKALKACMDGIALQPESAQLQKLEKEIECMEKSEAPLGVLRPSSAAPKVKSEAEKQALKAQLMRFEVERSAARQTEADHDWDAPGPRRDNM